MRHSARRYHSHADDHFVLRNSRLTPLVMVTTIVASGTSPRTAIHLMLTSEENVMHPVAARYLQIACFPPEEISHPGHVDAVTMIVHWIGVALANHYPVNNIGAAGQIERCKLRAGDSYQLFVRR
jgi:hypothetical protein